MHVHIRDAFKELAYLNVLVNKRVHSSRRNRQRSVLLPVSTSDIFRELPIRLPSPTFRAIHINYNGPVTTVSRPTEYGAHIAHTLTLCSHTESNQPHHRTCRPRSRPRPILQTVFVFWPGPALACSSDLVICGEAY